MTFRPSTGASLLLASVLGVTSGCGPAAQPMPDSGEYSCARQAISDERMAKLDTMIESESPLPVVVSLVVTGAGSQAEAIRQAQEQVLSALDPQDYVLRYRPRTVPQLFVAVNRQGLKVLACRPEVADIRAESTMKRR
ncbi:MAG: hypothetical protein ACOC00_07010 [Halothiobacillaceae bacterium]